MPAVVLKETVVAESVNVGAGTTTETVTVDDTVPLTAFTMSG